jgi:hypothetical protein
MGIEPTTFSLGTGSGHPSPLATTRDERTQNGLRGGPVHPGMTPDAPGPLETNVLNSDLNSDGEESGDSVRGVFE